MRAFLFISTFFSVLTTALAQPNLQYNTIYKSNITAGQGSIIYATGNWVYNSGSVNFDTTSIGYYLSKDNVVDNGDVFLGSVSLPSTVPGGSVNVASKALVVPANQPVGDYWLIHFIAHRSFVTESSKTDNLLLENVKVELPNFDLYSIFQKSYYQPLDRLPIGQRTDLFLITENRGNINTVNTFTSLYLSKDSVWDANDDVLGTYSDGNLNTGRNNRRYVSFVLSPSRTAGTYYLISKADASNVYAENNELNNITITKVVLAPASVDFTSRTWQSFPRNINGETYLHFTEQAQTIQVQNKGNMGGEELSYRFIFTDDTLNAPKKYIGKTNTHTFNHDPNLEFDFYLEDSVLVPKQLAKGKVFMGLWLDPENQWTEANESNNITWYPFNVLSSDTIYLGGELPLEGGCMFKPATIQSCQKVIHLKSLGSGTCFFLDDVFKLRSEQAKALTLSFTSFQMGKDTIAIYNGEKLVGKYSGTQNPGTIASTSGTIRVSRVGYFNTFGNETFTANVSCEGTVTDLSHSFEKEEMNLIYPNPSNGLVYFANSASRDRGQVVNGMGQVVLEWDVRPEKLDLQHLPKGAYLLRTLESDRYVTQTLLLK